jgi:hypothetical protein
MGSDQDKRRSGGGGLALAAAVVIDPRLADVWRSLWAAEAITPSGEDPRGPWLPADAIGPLLRMAYLQDHADAIESGEPAELYRELGVRRPEEASRSRARARRPRRAGAPRGSSDR